MSRKSIDTEWMRNVRVAEYFGVTEMTIWRWANDPKYAHLNFPKPAVINGLEYRKRPDLDTWTRSRVVEKAQPKSKTEAA